MNLQALIFMKLTVANGLYCECYVCDLLSVTDILSTVASKIRNFMPQQRIQDTYIIVVNKSMLRRNNLCQARMEAMPIM